MTRTDALAAARGAAAGRRRERARNTPAASRGAPDRSRCITAGCRRRARVCHECVRALAFKWWDSIARHDSGASRCELCEHAGGATYCAEHALDAIVEHRALMRSLGHRIGEPPPVDVADLLGRGRK